MPGQPGRGASSGPVLFYLKQFLTCLDLYAVVLCVFVFLQAVRFAREHQYQMQLAPWRNFWELISKRFLLGQIFQDIRFFHAVLIMFVEFALLKNLIPHVNSRLFDDIFVTSERLLCGGSLCAELLVPLWGGINPDYIGQHYKWYYPYMSLTAFTFIAAAPRRLAQEYLCAFAALFLIGVVWIYLLPTLGPVYYVPEVFSFLNGTDIGGLQQDLWGMREYLRAHPGSREAVFMISGFPSLHVAVVILGSFYLRALHWSLAALSWIFLVIIIHSTIYLGWHYILDDVGAGLLVLSCVWIARRFSWHWWGAADS